MSANHDPLCPKFYCDCGDSNRPAMFCALDPCCCESIYQAEERGRLSAYPKGHRRLRLSADCGPCLEGIGTIYPDLLMRFVVRHNNCLDKKEKS